MSNRKEIISHAALYLSAYVLTQVIGFVSSLLVRRFLGPVQQGMWSLLQVILIYTSWTIFGVTEVISRDIPFYRSRNNLDRAEKIKNSVFSFSMAASLVVAVGFLVFALLNRSHLKEGMFYGLLFVPLILMLQRYSTLQICFLRGYKNFSLASRLSVCSSIVNALLVAVLSYRYQIYGFMWAMCISYCFDLLFVMMQYKFNFRFYFDGRIIWEAIKFGFPLHLAGVATGIFLSADRIMIAKFLSFKELGLYSIAVMVFTYMRNFPNPVCVVLLPNLHERFGETGDVRQLKGYMTKAGVFFSNTMPLLIATSWFGVPYLVVRVIPDYAGGILALRCLITAGFFLALFQTYSYFIALLRKQIVLFVSMVSAALLAFALDYMALRAHLGIESVAVVNTTISFLLFTYIYFVSARYLFTASETLKNYLAYMAKFLLMMIVLGGLSVLFPNSLESLFQVIISCLTVALFFSPFWFKMLKEYDILNVLKERWLSAQVSPSREGSPAPLVNPAESQEKCS